jgi:hypothetical protein
MERFSDQTVDCDGCGRRETLSADGHRANDTKTIDDLSQLGWVLSTERQVGDGSNVHLCPACAG